MEREQIIKALECCALQSYPGCCECPYHDLYGNKCITTRNNDIKYLINSQEQRIRDLEVELKAMRGAANAYKMNIVELTEENERLHTSYTELTQKCASLTEVNEELRVVLKMNDAPFPEGLQIVHDFCEKRKRIVKADTVRKMQELIAEHATNGYPRKVRLDVIDQIAKEMLEGG